jgi:hypothetical protein
MEEAASLPKKPTQARTGIKPEVASLIESFTGLMFLKDQIDEFLITYPSYGLDGFAVLEHLRARFEDSTEPFVKIRYTAHVQVF